MPFCTSCGQQVQPGVRYCPNCGADVTQTAPQPPTYQQPQAAPQQPPTYQQPPPYQQPPTYQQAPPAQYQKVSALWWVVPFFFSIIGGIIAYAVVRKKNPTTARNLLIFGIVWFAIEMVISFGGIR